MHKFWKLLIILYKEQYLALRDQFRRGTILSLFLVLIYELQLFSYIGPLLKNPQYNSFIQYLKIYPIINHEITSIILLQIILSLTTIILIIIYCLSLRFYSYKEIPNKLLVSSQNMLGIPPLNQLANQQKGSSAHQNMNALLTFFFSLYAQLANFLFYQLQTYLTFKTIYLTLQTNTLNSIINIIALITSLITLMLLIPIIIFFNIHKFDYSFKIHDYLGQTYCDQVFIEFSFRYLQLALVTFIENTEHNPQIIILILFYAYSIVQGHRYQFYQNWLIQYFSTLLQGQLCLISILSYSDQQYLFQKYLLLGPFLLYLQAQIFQLMRINVKCFEDLRLYNQQELDMSLRFLYQQSMALFVKQKDIFNSINQKQYYSLQVYSLVANHLRFCNRSKCFCQEFFPLNTETTGKSWKRYTAQDDEFELEIEIGFKNEAHFKSFFTQLIKHIYEVYIKSTPEVSIQIWLSYIYFLTEIVKIPTKAFSEVLTLNGNPQFKSIKNSMIIEALVKRARDNFDSMIQKKDLKNQKYNFQIAFSYDVALKNVKINIINVIKNLHNWYGIIIYDKYNLKSIKQKGEILYNQIQLIQTQLDQIFQSNPLSLEIENLYQIYYRNLNYYQKRNKNYRKSSKLTNIYLNSAQKEVFNKDSFVIYITLLHPIGNVIKYTRNFPIMSGYKEENIQNSNIRSFMPDVLAKDHDMYLQNFVEKGRMNIVMTEHRFLFIKTKDKFIIPVWAKIRLENNSTEDFGASALVSKVNTQDNYILLNQYGRLEEISEQIFYQIQKILKVNIKSIKGIDFLMLMPQLWKAWRQNALIADQDQEAESDNGLIDRQLNIDAIMILPNTQKLIDQLLNNKSELTVKLKRYFDKHKTMLINYFNQLDDVTFFHLKYKIIEIKTINQIAYILEIQQNKQLKKQTQSEKMIKIRNILISIFPDYQEVKRQQTYHQDNCDVQQSLIMEDYLMEDLLIQNINKYKKNIVQSTLLLSSQRSNTLNQYSHHNENNTIPTIEERTPLIQVQEPVIQIANSFHHSNSFSSESQLDESNQMQKNDLGDRSSVASATGYQDQLSKKNLIKSILYGNLRNKSSIMIKIIFFMGMLGLVIFSTILLVQIYIGFQTIPNYSLVDKNIQNMKLIYNNFLMFNNTNITERLISEFNLQIEHFQSIQSNYNLILSVYDTNMKQNISIYYSLNQMKEHMVEVHQFNETATWQTLLDHYFQYQENFAILFHIINVESAKLIDSLYFSIYITFVASEIFVAILAGMLIPIQFSVQKKINHILGLLTTFNANQIEKQFSFFRSLQSIFIQGNFLSSDVSDDLIDKSKIKQNLIDSTLAEKQQKINVHHGFNKLRNLKKLKQNNCLIVASKLALTFILFIFLSAYYFSINILWNEQHTNLDTIFNQIDRTFELNVGLAQILSQLTQIKQYKVTQDYMNSFRQQEDFEVFTKQSEWQSFLDDISTKYWQINGSSTLNICEYFNLLPLINETHYYYPGYDKETCLQHNTSKSIGSVIGITTILHAYQQQKQFQQKISEIDYNMLINGMNLIAGLQILSTYQINMELPDRLYQYEIIHVVVYAINIFILMIAFYFGYIYLLRYIDAGVKNTKLLLTLIPIDFLTENSYVMSFMLQEQQIDQI